MHIPRAPNLLRSSPLHFLFLVHLLFLFLFLPFACPKLSPRRRPCTRNGSLDRQANVTGAAPRRSTHRQASFVAASRTPPRILLRVVVVVVLLLHPPSPRLPPRQAPATRIHAYSQFIPPQAGKQALTCFYGLFQALILLCSSSSCRHVPSSSSSAFRQRLLGVESKVASLLPRWFRSLSLFSLVEQFERERESWVCAGPGAEGCVGEAEFFILRGSVLISK